MAVVTLCLPPLSEDDPLFKEKKNLLNERNLNYKFEVPVSSTKEALLILNQMLRTARILYLNEVEFYFVEDDDFGPFSPRNELESLNSILTTTNSFISSVKTDSFKVLEVLQSTTVAMIRSVRVQNADEMAVDAFDADAENLLLEWAERHGVRTKLKVAYFQGAGRGALASEDISHEDTALEIPKSLIISEDLVCESDMFDVLKTLGGITAETMLLLWSMRERYNSSSKFKIYFDTLPERFNTGLSFGLHALTVLDGTLLFEELFQARQHLRQQYDAIFPALFTSHPDIFPPEMYSWDHFLWACELWYSNSMKIVFDDGNLRTCLVPIAGFLNHSLCPQILHYGRMDPATKTLKFNVSRPCATGEQCYLSYGNFPGSHLLTFYGFLPKGDNPYDVIPLDFDDPPAENASNWSASCETSQTTHMIRGTWLSKGNKPRTYGLPARLLAHLRVVLKGDSSELDCEDSGNLQRETERRVLETIMDIFNPMIEGLGDNDEIDQENCTWDVKLAADYKDLQRRIMSSVSESCSAGLRMLECP